MRNLTYMFWCLTVSVMTLTSCSKDRMGEELEAAELNSELPAISYSSFELEVVELVNSYRLESNLPELYLLDDGSHQAELHNQHMIEHNEVCHDDFPSRYSALVNDVHAKAVSENVAFGYRTAEAVVQAWIKSEGHRKNLLGDHTHFGISISEDANGKNYFTNIFVRK